MYLLLLLIIINVIALYIYAIEKYTNTPSLVYKTSFSKNKLLIKYSILDNIPDIFSELSTIKNVILTNDNKTDAILTDIFSYAEYYKTNYKLLTTLSDISKVLLLIKQTNDITNESLIHSINLNRKIGYINDIDIVLIKLLCISKDIDITKLIIKKVKVDNIDNATYIDNDIDILLLYTTLDNPIIKNISTSFKIDFINYTDDDIVKLQIMIPFAKTKDIDLTIYFKSFKQSDFIIKSCLCFNMMICVSNDIDTTKYLFELSKIIAKYANKELLNYYSMYFTLHEQTELFLRNVNKHVIERDRLSILEQFDSIVEPKNNINGFYDFQNNEFNINYDSLDGIKLFENSIVKLQNQNRDEENGLYKVIFIENKTFKGAAKTILKKINIVAQEEPNITYDQRYDCYNQDQIKSRGLCESDYDMMGVLKKEKTYWDRRCEKNEDCPFYQKNKNYKNYRGGCIDGYCEMPVGLRRVSYMKYDENTKPMCYNCKDKFNPYCCDEQENPDYAFNLDQYERIKQGLKNI